MSSNSSSSDGHCSESMAGRILSSTFSAIHIFLFTPLSICVLHIGYQRWRQQRSFATTSHSDVFAYHSLVQQLIFTLGHILIYFATYVGVSEVIFPGYCFITVYFPALLLFHVLTCVERYLAVVHPITYMGLKQSGGVRIRNISIACVWLQTIAWIGIAHLYFPDVPYVPYFFYLAASLLINSFCSISVLCVLIRPGPGNVSGDGHRVDPFKRRAFNTITAILAVLWVFLVSSFVTLAIANSNTTYCHDKHLTLMTSFWFSLPFSLVLPLQFMQRFRKMLNCPC